MKELVKYLEEELAKWEGLSVNQRTILLSPKEVVVLLKASVVLDCVNKNIPFGCINTLDKKGTVLTCRKVPLYARPRSFYIEQKLPGVATEATQGGSSVATGVDVND